MTTELQIKPTHDPLALNAEYRERGYLQIPDFLATESADYLYGLLLEHRDWYLTYNEGSENYESPASEFDALEAAQKQRFMNNVYGRARSGFQYIFRQYYITQAVRLGEQPGHPMHQLEAFANGEKFLGFMRQLTGREDVTKSDSYASLYGPGHFLTQHDDRHASHDRVAAWVISMTRDWREDWGGYLAFYDERGNIEAALKPSFNSLNLFSIPRKHAVQMVAPFAGHPRTSYLGWLQR